jgi:hypothetical protein
VKSPLNRSDAQSATWQKIEKCLRERLAELREQNDDAGGRETEAMTARRRGRIAELKEILALGDRPEA